MLDLLKESFENIIPIRLKRINLVMPFKKIASFRKKHRFITKLILL